MINEDLDINRNDEEPGDLYDSSRASFIRKVYGLLAVQLIITTLICAVAMNDPAFSNFFLQPPVYLCLFVVYIAMCFILGCCTDFARKYGLPILVVFTIVFGLIVGIICAGTSPVTVLTAAGITAVVVIALTIFSCIV